MQNVVRIFTSLIWARSKIVCVLIIFPSSTWFRVLLWLMCTYQHYQIWTLVRHLVAFDIDHFQIMQLIFNRRHFWYYGQQRNWSNHFIQAIGTLYMHTITITHTYTHAYHTLSPSYHCDIASSKKEKYIKKTRINVTFIYCWLRSMSCVLEDIVINNFGAFGMVEHKTDTLSCRD